MTCWICQEPETCPYPVCRLNNEQNIAPNEAKYAAMALVDKKLINVRNDNETALAGF